MNENYSLKAPLIEAYSGILASPLEQVKVNSAMKGMWVKIWASVEVYDLAWTLGLSQPAMNNNKIILENFMHTQFEFWLELKIWPITNFSFPVIIN